MTSMTFDFEDLTKIYGGAQYYPLYLFGYFINEFYCDLLYNFYNIFTSYSSFFNVIVTCWFTLHKCHIFNGILSPLLLVTWQIKLGRIQTQLY